MLRKTFALELWVDSDFAVVKRRLDHLFQRGPVKCAGGWCVFFFSETQKSVTFSRLVRTSMYVAMADGLKEAIFLRFRLEFSASRPGCGMYHSQRGQRRSVVFGDQARHQAQLEAYRCIRHHLIRERVERGEFHVDCPRADRGAAC